MILCDIGNTTFHFLRGDNTFKVSINKSLDGVFAEELEAGEFVYFISVNENESLVLKAKFPNAIDLSPFIKLNTHYAQTLGIDRAMACTTIEDGIVVDFGTAITVDIMKDGIHLGGYIFPGFDTLCRIYPQISDKLSFEFKENLELDTIPKNTNEAISMAILQMIVAPIKELQNKYKSKLIITGETAKYFLPYLDNFEIREKLIFENMKKIIEEIQ